MALVLLVRHGLTAGTRHVLTGRSPGVSLDERGREQARALHEEPALAEVAYGDWTGKPLRRLAKDPLWRVVQAHPSAVRFPGPAGEAMADMAHRAVGAVRAWNARLGKDAVYLICSHGDVIKAVLADCLGLHLDFCQRIQVDPGSLSVIRYTPLRPFLVRMNDTGDSAAGLARARRGAERAGNAPAGPGESDAAVGGGAGDQATTGGAGG